MGDEIEIRPGIVSGVDMYCEICIRWIFTCILYFIQIKSIFNF